jgi:copper chaperone CopZ
MTCSGCERTVTRVLSGIDGVTGVTTALQPSRVEITMSRHIETETLNAELAKVAKGKYVLLQDGVRNSFRSEEHTSHDSSTCAVAE